MANCFIFLTDDTSFYWVLNTNVIVLLRIWNITIFAYNEYYKSVDDDFDEITNIRPEIEFVDSFFASGTDTHISHEFLHKIAFIHEMQISLPRRYRFFISISG